VTEVRYFLDEHVATAVAKGLRRRGVDVLTVPDALTLGVSDADQLALARSHGRVFVTHDADYLRLAVGNQFHSGVVFATRQMPVGDLIRAVVLIHQILTAEDMVGRVQFI
jgi:predicted nuclease of predicted toxin-antitoxin system